jgi:macrolide transport system ATP-binding/permease protein
MAILPPRCGRSVSWTTGHQQFQQRIMHGAMIQTLLGLAVGIPVALLSARFVQSQLYEIASVHPLVLTGAVLTLAVAACIAGLIPAHRAASIDPQAALRIE